MYEATKDTKYLKRAEKIFEYLGMCGVPEHLSWGYWGSKCVCCGGPGALLRLYSVLNNMQISKFFEYYL